MGGKPSPIFLPLVLPSAAAALSLFMYVCVPGKVSAFTWIEPALVDGIRGPFPGLSTSLGCRGLARLSTKQSEKNSPLEKATARAWTRQ